MADQFKNHGAGLDSPARFAETVFPNDGVDLPNVSRAIYVGAPGDLVVDLVGGGTVTLVGASGILPICVSRVHQTGTTADFIVALW